MSKKIMRIIKSGIYKFYIIVLSVAICFITLETNISYARDIDDGKSLGQTTGHTAKEAGETIAAWAINFYNKHKGQAVYGGTSGYNKPVSDSDMSTTYNFHCVAFVSFVIHHALGLGGDGYTEFVKCPSNGSTMNHPPLVANGFERVDTPSSEWMPGDIIVMYHHVAVYVGDGKTIGMWTNGLVYIDALKDCNSNGGYQGWVGRITEEAASNACFEYLEGAGTGGIAGIDEYDGLIIDLDEVADMFDYDGMPTNISYEEKPSVFVWFFENITGFIDYYAGLLVATIKIPIVGFTSAFEKMINSAIHYFE